MAVSFSGPFSVDCHPEMVMGPDDASSLCVGLSSHRAAGFFGIDVRYGSASLFFYARRLWFLAGSLVGPRFVGPVVCYLSE